MNLSCPHYPRARQTTSHALSSDPRRCEVEVLRYPILPSTASNGELGSAQSSRLAIILNGREFTSLFHLLRSFPTYYRLPRSAFTPVSLRLPREESSFPNGGAAPSHSSLLEAITIGFRLPASTSAYVLFRMPHITLCTQVIYGQHAGSLALSCYPQTYKGRSCAEAKELSAARVQWKRAG